MSSKVGRVAVAQLRSSASKADNLVAIAKCAGWSRREGAAMLFLPECFGFIGQSAKETIAAAEPPLEEDTRTNPAAFQNYLEHMVDSCQKGGDTPMSLPQDSNDISLVDGLRTIARKSNLWISAGGMHVSGAPPSIYEPSKSRVFNTHVILDSSGEIKSTYRKIHLFDVSIPGKVSLQESATTAPGSELVVCDSPIGILGVTICYDVRFPETYVELLKRGAQVMLIPSAFTVPTGRAHWHTLLKARAIENQCYVVAAAQYGKHNEKRDSYGHSVIIDPWGELLADAGGYDGLGTMMNPQDLQTPSIIVRDISLDHLRDVRQRMPIQEHRTASSCN